MFDRKNLPLSPRKIWKKSLGQILSIVILDVILILLLNSMESGFGFSGLPFSLLSATLIIFTVSALAIIIAVVYQYYYYALYDYKFDERSGEIAKGVFSRATGYINYGRLQSIYVDRDFLDLLFGLYDIHYDTAGETSGFYSHVDGLVKQDAEKLVGFLKEKLDTGENKNAALFSNKSASISPVANNVPMAAPILPEEDKTAAVYDEIICPISTRLNYYYIVQNSLVFVYFGIMIIMGGNTIFDLGGILFLVLLFFIGTYIVAELWRRNYKFEFKEQSGVIETKLLSSNSTYLYYDRIQNVNVNQDFFSRLLGIYTLVIETAGEKSGTKLVIKGLQKENADLLKSFLLEKSREY